MRPDPTRRWTLKRIFAFGAACAALITVGAVALGAAALLRLSDARTALLNQVGPAVLAAQNLPGDLVDQETAVRGFVLSGGNSTFLDPYTQGRAAEDRDVAAIRTYLGSGDHPVIAADLAAVEAAAEAWRSGYAQPLLDRGSGAPEPPQGKELFDAIRSAAGTLQDDLNAERFAARDRLAAAANGLAWVGAGVLVMIAGFLVAAGFGLRRSVLRPVSDLAAQVRVVASGDVGHPITVDGPREIINLSADVESMRLAILGDLEADEGHQPAARRTGPGAGAVQQRPGAVRLRRQPRPAGAAAQGRELLPAAPAPLRAASSTSGPTSTSASRSTAPSACSS